MGFSRALPDVNTLIALTWPHHVHHEAARSWFLNNGLAAWATCPLTQCAFVRISSNPGIMVDAAQPSHALAILRELVSRGDHQFWGDDVDFSSESDIPVSLLQGHRQITDAYLLLLCKRHEGVLATLDSRLQNAVRNTTWEHLLLRVPI